VAEALQREAAQSKEQLDKALGALQERPAGGEPVIEC
jgi:hypothetical protein